MKVRGVTRPMPQEARLVAEVLRKDVSRPRYHPIGSPLRFDRVLISGDHGWSCPMGLHPDSRGRDEPYGMPFGRAGEAFAEWWDEQVDPEAAVEAVWGKPA